MILASPWPPLRGQGGILPCQDVSLGPGRTLVNWGPRRAPIADPGRSLVPSCQGEAQYLASVGEV